MRTLVVLAAAAATIAAASACRSGSSRPDRSAARPNILLVTIDTLRADRIGAGIAPRLDRLAAAGLRFTTARAAVPLTLPSHATILTGLLPPVHGVRENGIDVLDTRHQTVAQLLKSAGYQTAAVVGAFVLDRRFGLSQGFDVYDDQIQRDPNATERLEAERRASVVVDRAIAWVDEHQAPGTAHQAPGTALQAPGTAHQAPSTTHQAPSTQHQAPFFLWIHLYDPHAPYDPPSSARTEGNGRDGGQVEQRYNGEIAYADAELARLFDRLAQLTLLDRTLVVVAGDHGEGLGEHGESTHGMLLYDATLRVPLFLAGPGIAASVRTDPVGLVDIAPTILRVAGVTPPAEMRGQNLLAAPSTARGNQLQADQYAETQYPQVAGWSPLQALTDDRWKAIRAGNATELYDLTNDPGEQRDVSSAQPATATAMASLIASISGGGGTTRRSISADAQERLRTLGYVASSATPSGGTNARNPASMVRAWNAFEDALSALNAGRPGAAAALARLAAEHPDAPVFQTTYARALKDGGKPADALEVYRKAAKRWPTDATLLHDLAVAARETAQRSRLLQRLDLLRGTAEADALQQEAENAERAALVVSPASAVAHNGLGLIAADRERHADAVREFEQATTLDPNNASYWTNLGNAKRAAGDLRGAEQAYKRALEVDPAFADAANGLGVLLVEAQRPAEAAPWFERALTAAPGLVDARLNLGIARQQAGDAKGAADAYRGVLAARGDYPSQKAAAAKLLASLGGAR